MDSEATLVARLQRGDEAALAELYDRLGTQVYSLALKLLNSHEEAEEVVQDTFMKLYNANSYRTPQNSPRAYIYTIARNLALSRLRKRQVRPLKADAVDVYDPSTRVGATSNDPTTKLLTEKLLGTLQDEERRLLEESFYDGYTHAQLSERNDMPLGTVKSKLRRALHKLRDTWETL